MNQREARIRGLKIAIHILKEAFAISAAVRLVQAGLSDFLSQNL